MKKIILHFILVLLSLTLIFSCYKATINNIKESALAPIKKTVPDSAHSKIPLEVYELLKIRDALAYRVVKMRVSEPDLTAAYNIGDTKKLQLLLGITDTELIEYQTRINKLKESLLNNYPELKKEYLRQISCKTCITINITEIYKKVTARGFFKIINGEPLNVVSPDKINYLLSENDCSWIPYSACLIVCTSTGPILYWPCAYVCMCSFCTNIPGCNNLTD